MSYQLKVLRDHPIGFWTLDELYSSSYSAQTYNDSALTYNQTVFYNSGGTLTEYPIDKSGCGNDGVYKGSFPLNDYLMPLVAGGLYGTNITSTGWIELPVTKNYYGSTVSNGLANKYTSDNDFTLELWAFPRITTTALTPIFADTTNSIGIFWQNGNLIFKLQGTSIEHTVVQKNQAMHIAAVYGSNSMSLYLNGNIVSSKILTGFAFSNLSTLFQIGPTTSASDSIVIDAPAIYRYSLSIDQVRQHYLASFPISPMQVVTPDSGELFVLSDLNIAKTYSVVYSIDKKWSEFYDANMYYDQNENSISLISSDTAVAKSVILTDKFTIPTGIGLISSKIDWNGSSWNGSYGLKIETSTDGVTYTQCENGKLVPGYKIGTSSFSTTGEVYVRITLSTDDASRYLPKLYAIKFSFYTTKLIYAKNGPSYIEPIQPASTTGGLDGSVWDYDLGTIDYPVLSRNIKTGLRPSQPGFAINTSSAIKTVEMIFSPISTAANYLMYADANTQYSWNGSGVISKGSNIAAIYVDGIDRTSATNISSYLFAGDIYHIVIVLIASVTTRIWFNVKVASNVWSDAGPANSYNYIGIYQTAFSATAALNHSDQYTGRPAATVNEPVISLTESSVKTYNRDWVVVKNV